MDTCVDRSSIEEAFVCVCVTAREKERAENKGGALMIDDLIQMDVQFRPCIIDNSYPAQQEHHPKERCMIRLIGDACLVLHTAAEASCLLWYSAWSWYLQAGRYHTLGIGT